MQSLKASFAKDVDIHKTKLNRILNNKENPNIDLMYRLEYHSGNMIPAIYWFRLYTRKLENNIKENKKKRLEEGRRVQNELSFG